MRKRNYLIGFMVLICSVFLFAGLVSAETKAQKMLKAKRGAQVDAYRKLSELIKGLQISAGTYVRDFVTESDEIRTQFNDFIKGAKVVSGPRFIDEADGSLTAEMDVKVTFLQVMQGLAQMSYNRGPNKPPLDLTYMKEHTRKKEFVATGTANTGRAAPPVTSAYGQQSNYSGHYGARRQSPTAGIPGWENVTGQGRLKAERAALTDARRNLAETVEGLKITGNTYVRDFVTESDEIRTSVNAFIKGIKQISPYRYYDDGIVEVDVQVTIQDIIKELTKVRQHLVQRGVNWQRDVFRTVQFEEIKGWTKKKVITAVGNGAVHERDYFNAGPASNVTNVVPVQSAPEWVVRTVQAVGVGVPAPGDVGPAARIKAERAAEMDARRNLVEQIYGVRINSQTTVRDFVLENDRVNADVTAFLSGARKVGETVYNDDGSVEVTVEVALDGLWTIVQSR